MRGRSKLRHHSGGALCIYFKDRVRLRRAGAGCWRVMYSKVLNVPRPLQDIKSHVRVFSDFAFEEYRGAWRRREKHTSLRLNRVPVYLACQPGAVLPQY